MFPHARRRPAPASLDTVARPKYDRAMPRAPDENPHYERLLELLDIERRDEEARLRADRANLPVAEREARGELLSRLEVVAEEVGLSGRTLVTFAKAGGAELPPGAARVGDCVAVVPPTGERPHAG